MKRRCLENVVYQKFLLDHEKKWNRTTFGLMSPINYHMSIEANEKKYLLSSLFEMDEVSQEELNLDQDVETIKNSTQNFEDLFTLKFLTAPSEELKQKLRERNFFFNFFRNEYYGRGDKFEIEELLKGYSFKLEKFFP